VWQLANVESALDNKECAARRLLCVERSPIPPKRGIADIPSVASTWTAPRLMLSLLPSQPETELRQHQR
jgi:hypothetical protein